MLTVMRIGKGRVCQHFRRGLIYGCAPGAMQREAFPVSRKSPSIPRDDQSLGADCAITENTKQTTAAKKQGL